MPLKHTRTLRTVWSWKELSSGLSKGHAAEPITTISHRWVLRRPVLEKRRLRNLKVEPGGTKESCKFWDRTFWFN